MAAETAAHGLFKEIRSFALRTPAYVSSLSYFTKPDERFDLTLVSKRVYGTREFALVIQAAAGLDSPEQELTERPLTLPTADSLYDLCRRIGFPVSGR